MAAIFQKNLNFSEIQAKLQAQFSRLDPNDPSVWPSLPRYLLFAVVCLGVMVAAWFFWVKPLAEEVETGKQAEESLRIKYREKLVQAVNLAPLKKQREQIRQYVNLLERQLPSSAEMDALLSDINHAGLGRSLQFESLRPGQVIVNDYYAELPIAVKVTGTYHDIALFVADVANLSRIVTFNNLVLTPTSKDSGNLLTLDCMAKTFRYLSPEEVELRKKSKEGAK